MAATDRSPRRVSRTRARHALAVVLTRWGLGSLHSPPSRVFGFDRGTPLDRRFIEEFLGRHAGDIRGRTLEIKDDAYTSRFGAGRTARRDVLDLDARNPAANVIADLNEPGSLPRDTYDCIVVTQVLQFLHPEPAIGNLYGSLRSGGVLLVTTPALAALESAPPDLWRYSAAGLEAVLRAHLPPEATVSAEHHGNAIMAAAFLLGFSAEEMSPRLPSFDDGRCPMVAMAHVRRP